ncbi:DegT/DnrJ/EryC1/StrS family aminotransferase [Heliomicrobium undosum]|uniref:DegT/DnrJ/EryC1/StrS family aminotransferase n=1 Tax=Heliomicrobium undosum TaxID=121734 RepID=UPI002E27CE7F|nr:DegT/DnrJ/EryC1/StrS family aminotransferase [Heliomicrobium undosum]
MPLLDLKAHNAPLKAELMAAVEEVVDSCGFIMGPKVEAFEKEAAAYLGVKHAIGVSSGTDALLVALMACGIGPGDAVITTDFSFFATAGAVSRLGARPFFTDINPVTYNMDVESARAAIEMAKSAGYRPKAIIPVHLYGQSADMKAIMALAAETSLAVIEDAAQAIGVRYPVDGHPQGLCVGAIGDMGCFSFFPSKNLGCFGDGGLVTTQSDALAEKIRILRAHGSRPKYYHAIIGGNFRLDALQAAVLSVKLPLLDQWHANRRRNAARYREMLQQTKAVSDGWIQLPVDVYDGLVPHSHIYNQFVIRVDRRDELKEYLKDNGVGTEIYYPVPFHRQICFADLAYPAEAFPESDKAAAETLALPIYPELTQEMQDHVVGAIDSFYSK